MYILFTLYTQFLYKIYIIFTYFTNIYLIIIPSNKFIHSLNMSTPYVPHKLRYCFTKFNKLFAQCSFLKPWFNNLFIKSEILILKSSKYVFTYLAILLNPFAYKTLSCLKKSLKIIDISFVLNKIYFFTLTLISNFY